jgi:hypothetical protein
MRIQDEKIWEGKKSDPESGMNIPDPQHCICILHIYSVTPLHVRVKLILHSQHAAVGDIYIPEYNTVPVYIVLEF